MRWRNLKTDPPQPNDGDFVTQKKVLIALQSEEIIFGLVSIWKDGRLFWAQYDPKLNLFYPLRTKDNILFWMEIELSLNDSN